MKTLLSFVVFLLAIQTNYAQETYFPLLDTNKTWHVAEGGFGAITNTYTYKCMGDTVYDGDQYHILWRSDEEFPVNWSKWGYIREEDHEVYYSPFNPSTIEPELLYNFNAGVGDTLSVSCFAYNSNNPAHLVIVEIDSVLINNEYRKRTWYDCAGWNESKNFRYWIEGIGSDNGLIEPGFYCTIICPTIELLCVKDDGDLLFMNEYFSECYIVNVDETIQNNHLFEVYPNPAKNYLLISPVSNNLVSNSLVLTSLQGIIIEEFVLNPEQPTTIDISNLESGLYFYKIIGEGRKAQIGKILIH